MTFPMLGYLPFLLLRSKITKGVEMEYPMNTYKVWETELVKKHPIDSHAKWNEAEKKLRFDILSAQPVDGNDKQSSWLTLPRYGICQ